MGHVRGASHHPQISIHAPREGSDTQRSPEADTPAISIHAPREGSDVSALIGAFCAFLISIHAPREGSDSGSCCRHQRSPAISIHAPREGSDAAPTTPAAGGQENFNPRSP